MNYTRIFTSQDFHFGDQLTLSSEASKHLRKVLRKKQGNLIELFDGKGTSCLAEIISLDKNKLEVKVVEEKVFKARHGINIFLGQSLIKSEPFRFSIQKATELGVISITPLITERTVVKLNHHSKISRHSRWKTIAVGACQQCGENWIPEINKIQNLESWCNQVKAKHKIVLSPQAKMKLSDFNYRQSVAVTVGPEGDFTQNEISFLKKRGFIPVSLGERLLRAETAVVSSLSSIRTMCKEF